MKKVIYWLIGLGLVLIVGAVLFFVLRKGPKDCSVALPHDASLVAKIDLRSLLEQDGVELSDLSDSSFSVEKLGLDLSQPAYAFAYRSYFGAVIPMKDMQKLLDITFLMHSKVEQQRGLQWTVFGGSFLVCYDNEKAMVIGPATSAEQEELRGVLYNCMKQTAKEGGSDLMERLWERSEPIALATSLEALPGRYLSYVKGIMPEGVSGEDFIVSAGLTTKGNEMTMNVTLSAEGAKAKEFLATLEGAFRPMDATLFETAIEGAFLHLEAGIEGDKIIELLRKNPETRTKLLGLNMIVDLDMILKSIHGDVAFTLPRFGLFDTPKLLQANVRDDKFMQNVDSWNEGVTEQTGIRFTPAGGGNYCFTYDYDTYYFGVHHKRLFLTNDEQYVADDRELPTVVLEDAKGCRIYVQLDISSMADAFSFIPTGNSLRGVQGLTMKCKHINDWTITLRAAEGVDILKTIIP